MTTTTQISGFNIEACPECATFSGARLEWCLGGKGDRKRANQWRRGQKLPPLPPLERNPPAVGSQAKSSGPGIIQRATNYAGAVVKHVCTGIKTATQEQIDARLAICRECPLYDAAAEICQKCGCCASGKKSALTNKLAMASSVCPHPDGPRWGAITEDPNG